MLPVDSRETTAFPGYTLKIPLTPLPSKERPYPVDSNRRGDSSMKMTKDLTPRAIKD
jgi:hypothetical protein